MIQIKYLKSPLPLPSLKVETEAEKRKKVLRWGGGALLPKPQPNKTNQPLAIILTDESEIAKYCTMFPFSQTVARGRKHQICPLPPPPLLFLTAGKREYGKNRKNRTEMGGKGGKISASPFFLPFGKTRELLLSPP